MEKNSQLNFLFDASTDDDYKSAIKAKNITPIKTKEVKQSAIAWLLKQAPSGIGLSVPTRISRYKADIVAFWASPKNKIMLTDKTVIIELRNKREDCWPDCSRHENMLPQLIKLKARKNQLESEIRKNEPHLRDSDMLFDDYSQWNYSESTNKDYHKCYKSIDQVEHVIYKGSRFEQIRRASVANYLYLAVPSGSVHPHELADGWGLLYINDDLTIEVIKEASHWECDQKHKLHLVQNVAISNTNNLLFSMGVHKKSSDDIRISKIPQKRHAFKKIPY